MKQRHTTPRRGSSSRSRAGARESKRAPQPGKQPLVPTNPLALQPFDPEPTAVYSLETAAQIADVPRRTILIYCKHKFISPVVEPGIWGYWFDADAIRTLRAIRELRGKCSDELESLGVILNLVDEIKTLRAEIRARQNHF
jgi:MerR family transcriptional regulator/heat shock protein HspR